MSDTEKVSFNLSVVDLGQVDLLVDQGFYANRTDFMVTAARNLLLTHTTAVTALVTRQSLVVGVHVMGKKMLESLLSRGKQLDIKVVGVFVLSKDVTPRLALAVIQSIKVFGSFRASPQLKEALRDRIQ